MFLPFFLLFSILDGNTCLYSVVLSNQSCTEIGNSMINILPGRMTVRFLSSNIITTVYVETVMPGLVWRHKQDRLPVFYLSVSLSLQVSLTVTENSRTAYLYPYLSPMSMIPLLLFLE